MAAPLIPKILAILVLDQEGSRLAGKYYDKDTFKNNTDEMEAQLHSKCIAAGATPQVVTCSQPSCTAVYTGSADVRIVTLGPTTESELVLAHLNSGMYEALSQLMGGSIERTMVLDNLELVFLLIDEHCDGGLILETDPHKLAQAVLLRDEGDVSNASDGDFMAATNSTDMTLGQAFRQARDQFFVGMSSRDGM